MDDLYTPLGGKFGKIIPDYPLHNFEYFAKIVPTLSYGVTVAQQILTLFV